jgi:hypothetical protein
MFRISKKYDIEMRYSPEIKRKEIWISGMRNIHATLHKIALKSKSKTKLRNTLNDFINSKQNLNILLHRQTNSLIIEAIAKYISCDIYYLNLTKNITNQDFKMIVDYVMSCNGIIVLLYIDIVNLCPNGDKPEGYLSLWTLTETLKGSLTIPNSIFIMPTFDSNSIDESVYKCFDVTIYCN